MSKLVVSEVISEHRREYYCRRTIKLNLRGAFPPKVEENGKRACFPSGREDTRSRSRRQGVYP